MMKPRHNKSVKKTEFPSDYIKLIKDVINKNFKAHVKGKTLEVEGMIYPEEVLIRIAFKTAKTVSQRNFEASVSHSLKTKNIMDQIYLAIDALGAMIDQFFKEGGEIDMPLKWTEFKFDGRSVWLQTSTENSDLEAQAEEFLRKAGVNPDELKDDLELLESSDDELAADADEEDPSNEDPKKH